MDGRCDKISPGAAIGFALLAGVLGFGLQYGLSEIAGRLVAINSKGRLAALSVGSTVLMTGLGAGALAIKRIPRALSIPVAAGFTALSLTNLLGTLALISKMPPMPQQLPPAGGSTGT